MENAHAFGKLRSRKWKGTLTLLESHVHVNGKPRSRKWKGTLTLLENYAHVNGKKILQQLIFLSDNFPLFNATPKR
jgi:hypothetical protein